MGLDFVLNCTYSAKTFILLHQWKLGVEIIHKRLDARDIQLMAEITKYISSNLDRIVRETKRNIISTILISKN